MLRIVIFLAVLTWGLLPGALTPAWAGEAPGNESAEPFAAPEQEALAMGQAVRAAKSWLELVDKGEYAASWQEASDLFKMALPQEEWERKCAAARTPFGALISRERASAQYTETLPGVPDGKYVVIQFDTRFENKARAIETVTAQLEKDGNWRVGGYYIH